MTPPPPTELSAQGGGSESLSTQGAVTVMGSSNQDAVVPLDGSGVVEDDQKKSGEEEEKVEECGNGREVVATPPDDLNIQWTTSTPGSSKEAVEGPPSGLEVGEGGGAMVVDDNGERVASTHPVEPSAQPVKTEEGRDVVAPTEEEVIVEEAGGSEGERERATSGEEREEPRGDGASGSGDDLKGKRVATEEPVREQGPVGITLGDYAVHADPEDMAAIEREAPGVLNAVREEVVGEREGGGVDTGGRGGGGGA